MFLADSEDVVDRLPDLTAYAKPTASRAKVRRAFRRRTTAEGLAHREFLAKNFSSPEP